MLDVTAEIANSRLAALGNITAACRLLRVELDPKPTNTRCD